MDIVDFVVPVNRVVERDSIDRDIGPLLPRIQISLLDPEIAVMDGVEGLPEGLGAELVQGVGVGHLSEESSLIYVDNSSLKGVIKFTTARKKDPTQDSRHD